VNHGGREAVELFEVSAVGEVSLAWRGCALPPDQAILNDVVALPDGGFLATKMYSSSRTTPGILTLGRALLGMETGEVLEWQPGAGFREVPGTRGSIPNGIEVSDDGE
jgi:sugar lactone lactonase YvrE